MLCALSGQPPKDPVVSPRSGAVFERHLVENFIATTGKDPVSDEPLSIDDLVALKPVPETVPPRPPAFNSIPTMLAGFQNEWDALALETYTLRKQLHLARQELSDALYQYDAAVRVAAKAIRERDEAQAALQVLSETFARGETTEQGGDRKETKTEEATPEETKEGTEKDSEGVVTMDNENVVSSLVAETLTAAQQRLFAQHKKSKVTFPVTKTLALSIEETTEQFADDVTFACSADSTVLAVCPGSIRVLDGSSYNTDATVGALLHDQGKTRPVAVSQGHVMDLDSGSLGVEVGSPKFLVAHPSEPLFVAVNDTEWVLCDEKTTLSTAQITHATEDGKVTAADIHVDGVLLGVGVSGSVAIFDLTTTQNVSTILAKYPHIDRIQFALNGYWLVVTSSDGESAAVEVFDLRKNSLVHLIACEEPIDAVLDASCSVLATYGRTSHQLKTHLYIKKGKLWVENAAEISSGAFLTLLPASSAHEVNETKVVKLVGVGRELHRFNISIQK